MRRHVLVLGALVVQGVAAYAIQGCSGDDNGGPVVTPDASTHDSSTVDSGGGDVSSPDAAVDSSTDSAIDASDGGCPGAWMLVPVVDPSITVPGDAGPMFLHAGAVGTQDYQCQASVTDGGADGGDAGTTYAWVFVAPEAELRDCNSVKIGSHFASDGGSTRPEWMEIGGDYVIGKKDQQFIPDGGAASIPWLLLEKVSTGGSGPLTKTNNVQRLYTDGGIAPSTACDSNNVNTTTKVPYAADYYFYGQ